MCKKSLLFFLLSTTILICSCDKEEEMEMEMVSINITSKIVGDYQGTNRFGESGSAFTEESRTASVSTVSDSTIEITVSSSFTSISLIGEMENETSFDINDGGVWDEEGYSGSGSLSGEDISIQMSLNNKSYEFTGTKQ